MNKKSRPPGFPAASVIPRGYKKPTPEQQDILKTLRSALRDAWEQGNMDVVAELNLALERMMQELRNK